MASGKQLSFQYGEVSPSLRFRSDAVSYSEGLSKLKNMYVRKAGGVSNRAGFKFVMEAESQLGIPEEAGNPAIKSFIFWDTVVGDWRILEYRQTGATTFGLYIRTGLDYSGTATAVSGASSIISPEPYKVKFTILKNHVLITPEFVKTGSSYNYLLEFGTSSVTTIGTGIFPTPAVSGRGSGAAPYLPVSYLLTATINDGTEVYVFNMSTTGYDPATWNANTAPASPNVLYPHSSWSNNFRFTWGAIAQPFLNNVRYFNLYRAAGAAGLNGSFFKLAGRQIYTSGLTIDFHDYGSDSPSIVPPTDNSVYKDGLSLSSVEVAAYYQQRLIYVFKDNQLPISKSGDIFASKIGAPTQVLMPYIYSDTEAFQFSVPVTDGTSVIAMLPMERLIALTKRGVYVIRGGEQGILTPTMVNPLLISEEGCSETVEPKMAGRRGYFLNNTHTKLMAIEFGDDGNLDVGDISIVSDHLILQEDFTQLEVIGGVEDTVYLLRRDGKMLQITCHAGGEHGFSLIETDGYIESIYRGKALLPYVNRIIENTNRYYDVLMMYVIRNDKRVLEQLELRNDEYKEGELFLDCSRFFGTRLSKNDINGYAQTRCDGLVFLNASCNLKSSSGWSAGTTIKLRSDSNFLDFENPSEIRVRFFYEEDGEELTLDFEWDGINAVPVVGDGIFTYEYSGTFDKAVPDSLQDVKAQSISTYEKQLRYTRWLPAYNKLRTGTVQGDYALPGPWIGASESVTDANAPVAVVADGKVISSPLDTSKDPLYIENDGVDLSLEFPEFYCYGYIGIPYESDMETLDIEATDARTLTDARKLLNAVGVAFQNTRGGYFGIESADVDNMSPISPSSYSPFNNEADEDNFNGHIKIPIPTQWSERGRIRIRQIDPLPMTVLAVYPKGIAGD